MSAPTFTDTAARTWRVAFTPAAVRTIRTVLGIDLARLVKDPAKLGAALFGPAAPPELVVQLAAVVCHEQREERLVSPEEFGRALTDPTTYEAAGRALFAALAAYYPHSAWGRGIRAALAAAN